MASRSYSNTATPNALSGSINATDVVTTATLQAPLSGWPDSAPFLAALDENGAAEELVLVTAYSGSSVTFTRGYDGTTKVVHANLASFTHVAAAIDYREANQHIQTSMGVHGIGPSSSVVGTTDSQTLANKSLTAPAIDSFLAAQHDHTSGAEGGNIPESAVTGLVADLASKATNTALALKADATTVATLTTTVAGKADASTTTTALGLKADDSAVVHKTGTETVAGAKTLSGLATLTAGLALAANAANTVPTTPDLGVKVHFGTASFTCDTSGFFTVTHGAGFTPSGVVAFLNVTGGVGGPLVGADTLASTTFRARISNQSSTFSGSVFFICWG